MIAGGITYRGIYWSFAFFKFFYKLNIGGSTINYIYPIIKVIFVSFIFLIASISIKGPSTEDNCQQNSLKNGTIIIKK